MKLKLLVRLCPIVLLNSIGAQEFKIGYANAEYFIKCHAGGQLIPRSRQMKTL